MSKILINNALRVFEGSGLLQENIQTIAHSGSLRLGRVHNKNYRKRCMDQNYSNYALNYIVFFCFTEIFYD